MFGLILVCSFIRQACIQNIFFEFLFRYVCCMVVLASLIFSQGTWFQPVLLLGLWRHQVCVKLPWWDLSLSQCHSLVNSGYSLCGETISHSVVSDSLQPHGLQPTRLLCLWQEFSRQEPWSGQPFPSPGDLPNPGTKPASPALHGSQILYYLSHQGSGQNDKRHGGKRDGACSVTF